MFDMKVSSVPTALKMALNEDIKSYYELIVRERKMFYVILIIGFADFRCNSHFNLMLLFCCHTTQLPYFAHPEAPLSIIILLCDFNDF